MLSTLVCFVLCVCLVLCMKIRFSRTGRLMAKIPAMEPYPIIGNAFDFFISPEKTFELFGKFYQHSKSICKLYAFNIYYVNLYRPEDIETILSSNEYNNKAEGYRFLKPWLGDGLLISNDEKWRHRRKLLNAGFYSNQLKTFMNTFNERAYEMVHNIKTQETLSLWNLVTNTTLKIMCETLMGTSMNEGLSKVVEKYFESIHFLSNCILYRNCRIWLHPDLVYNIIYGHKMRKNLRSAHEFTANIIDQRRIYRRKHIKENNVADKEVYSDQANERSMLDLLLKEEERGNINKDGIREEVDTFVFEGHDTTAGALVYIIMSLANESDVQEKVFNEMRSIFGDSDRAPTVEDLNKMKYLECCIKEGLRLYPSVPVFARTLIKEAVLGGYTVPAGVTVVMNIFQMHRRADLYPDAEKFLPERFLLENSVDRHKYAYLPFSAGPRNCIGQKFAMMEMKTCLSHVVRCCRLEAVTTPQELVFVADITLKTRDPIYVRFLKRDH